MLKYTLVEDVLLDVETLTAVNTTRPFQINEAILAGAGIPGSLNLSTSSVSYVTSYGTLQRTSNQGDDASLVYENHGLSSTQRSRPAANTSFRRPRRS
ncbi:hypothetical protein D918_03795 [Trichuris suis]|nr:hypothetical protein D918_03795 [Trichuris suis]